MNWINVEEKLPPIHQKVILYSPRLGVFILALGKSNMDDGLVFAGYDTEPFTERITHWMPLPKLPEYKVCCAECKHLMFSDCYGECSKGYKGIVRPDDSCGNGKLR